MGPKLSLTLIMLISSYFIAQGPPINDRGLVIPSRPLNCDESLVYLEQLVRMTREQVRRGGLLIIVARLGDGEKSRELSRRRLHNMREYQREYGVPREKIVVAEGERVTGLGRVEFYLGGEIAGTIPIKRNGCICGSCCGPDEKYYSAGDCLTTGLGGVPQRSIVPKRRTTNR